MTSEIAAVIVTLAFLGFLKWAVTQFKSMMDAFSDTVQGSIEANTRVTTENYEYLKMRNGSLEKNNQETAKQLRSISQTVKETAETARDTAQIVHKIKEMNEHGD